jgi:hypothetical protein
MTTIYDYLQGYVMYYDDEENDGEEGVNQNVLSCESYRCSKKREVATKGGDKRRSVDKKRKSA